MTLPLRRGALLPFLLAALGLAPPAVRGDGDSGPSPLGAAGAAEGELGPTAAAAATHVGDEGPPAEVGPYRVLAALGAGGMGVVHSAESTGAVRRRVALKRVRSAVVSDAERAQFAVEVEALSRLEHEHVVRIEDAGVTDDGTPWLAMELVDGEPLTRYCERRELDLDARLALAADTARAVAHMHARGVAHGDLKPRNILVCERDGRPVVKVIDLGSARLAGGHDGTPRALMGTLRYMAPELLQGEVPGGDAGTVGGDVGIGDGEAASLDVDDARSGDTSQLAAELCDVYALGIVLRELILGDERGERDGEGWLGAALARATKPLPAPRAALDARVRRVGQPRATSRGLAVRDVRRRLGRGLEAVLERATAFEARRRTSSAAALAAALDHDVADARLAAATRQRVTEWCVAAGLGAGAAWVCL